MIDRVITTPHCTVNTSTYVTAAASDAISTGM